MTQDESPRETWLKRMGGTKQPDGSWIVPPQPSNTYRRLDPDEAREIRRRLDEHEEFLDGPD